MISESSYLLPGSLHGGSCQGSSSSCSPRHIPDGFLIPTSWQSQLLPTTFKPAAPCKIFWISEQIFYWLSGPTNISQSSSCGKKKKATHTPPHPSSRESSTNLIVLLLSQQSFKAKRRALDYRWLLQQQGQLRSGFLGVKGYASIYPSI